MKFRRYAGIGAFYLLIIGIFIAVTIWTSSATDVISEMIPVNREYIIVIDAGHGGEDGGATSWSGVLESRFNLEIALRLNDLLKLLGYETKMIRTTDVSIYTHGTTIAAKKVSDLKERVRIVNETENAVLISIHQNTFPDEKYHGAQVFHPTGEKSRLLASMTQTAFTQTINPGSSRKIKQADGIYLMEHIRCPGILVECGFLSNPEEEAKLRSTDYQQKICCVIASALSNFLDQQTND